MQLNERIYQLFLKAKSLQRTVTLFDEIDFGEDDPAELDRIRDEKKRALRICIMVLQNQCQNWDSENPEQSLIPTWELVEKELGL